MVKNYEVLWVDGEAKKIMKKLKADEEGFKSFSDIIKEKFGEKKKNDMFPKW